ncbi:MAG: YggS family pyridoxal phosphate-dependent enzyme [Desulfobulbaceae bacterium]|nr:MAG: YggS family pyridoxal phosphate-dependent enzyme [Desulfobulbaceae bacterium]
MIRQNLQAILNTISDRALLSNRRPEEIQLIAVTKTMPISALEEAVECGQFVFGENYIQEASLKKEALGDRIALHMLGHIQSNKAKIAAQIFDMIHTVDSMKLASILDRHLDSLCRTMKILVQVNIGNDPNKSGVMPEKAEELLRQLKTLKRVETLGLMTIPPITTNPEDARQHFRSLKQLAEDLSRKELFFDNAKIELSMGMSDDFEIAIEEGATMVRIGTAIFGHRPLAQPAITTQSTKE